jgi:hypothetical protein
MYQFSEGVIFNRATFTLCWWKSSHQQLSTHVGRPKLAMVAAGRQQLARKESSSYFLSRSCSHRCPCTPLQPHTGTRQDLIGEKYRAKERRARGEEGRRSGWHIPRSACGGGGGRCGHVEAGDDEPCSSPSEVRGDR